MSTTVYIPVEEYLHTSYRPDCDYVDGEVEERVLGEERHGLIQGAIYAIFREHRRAWGFRSIPEQRIQVAAKRFRVPDVCVVPSTQSVGDVLRTPPVLCVEVLSPDDRFSRVLQRVQDYIDMGVPHVWIIDSVSREIWTVSGKDRPLPLVGDTLTLPGTPVRIPVADIFAEIDEAPPAA